MTSELRPAFQVAYEAWEEWDDEFGATIDARQKAAAAVIEADREAVRAPLLAEIERLRAVLDNIAHESSDTWARRDACVALGIDWPEARRQP